jgi:hypothetical protein
MPHFFDRINRMDWIREWEGICPEVLAGRRAEGRIKKDELRSGINRIRSEPRNTRNTLTLMKSLDRMNWIIKREDLFSESDFIRAILSSCLKWLLPLKSPLITGRFMHAFEVRLEVMKCA